MTAKENIRKHMLAATMSTRWETLAEISAALRKEYGVRLTRIDLIGWLQEFAHDGAHTLASRVREGSSLKEFRLYVKEVTP